MRCHHCTCWPAISSSIYSQQIRGAAFHFLEMWKHWYSTSCSSKHSHQEKAANVNGSWAGYNKNHHAVVNSKQWKYLHQHIYDYMRAASIAINRRVAYRSWERSAAAVFWPCPPLIWPPQRYTALVCDVIPYSLLWLVLLLTAAVTYWLHNISTCLRHKKYAGDWDELLTLRTQVSCCSSAEQSPALRSLIKNH